ncbi:hypothetical protein FF1_004568 [Malus domestica]
MSSNSLDSLSDAGWLLDAPTTAPSFTEAPMTALLAHSPRTTCSPQRGMPPGSEDFLWPVMSASFLWP